LKQLLTAVLFAALFGSLCVTPRVTAQEQPAPQPALAEYVARSERLREFGFPLLARAQLDKAARLDPTNRTLLIEYLRLFTRSQAEVKETLPYVKSLLALYPEDYEACLEIAWWLFLTAEPALPPGTGGADELKRGLERLDAEMAVYRELAKYILQAGDKLPEAAKGKPALPLAFLARCAKTQPLTAEVAYLAARDLDTRAREFHRWSRTDDLLSEPFGKAAQEVYGLALPLYQAAARDEVYHVTSSVSIAGLLYRMRRYEEAKKAVVAAEQVAPGNLDVADTRLGIAEAERDFEQLLYALQNFNEIYGDVSSRIDLSAVERIKANGWSFDLWLAWRELHVMDPGERTGAIRVLLQQQPEFLEVYYLDARNALDYAERERDPEARARLYVVVLQALDKCKALGERFADWHGLRAAALWELAEFEQAAKSYDEVARLDPGDEEAPRHARAARDITAGSYTAFDYDLYRRQLGYGNLKDKRTILREVVKRSPRFFAAQLLLGKVAFMLGDWESAWGAYAAGNQLEPENLECLDGAARAAMRSGRYAESLKLFTALNKLQPDFEGALRWQGIVEWVAGGSKERQRAFQLWLEASAGSTDATARQKLLEEAVLLEPDFAEVLVELAALVRAARPQLAESYLERALQCAREDLMRAVVMRERGRLRLMKNRFQEAIGDFESAYALDKGDGTDLLLIALARHESGDEAAASAALRKLFAELPESPLLRPTLRDLRKLDMPPVKPGGVRELHPAYDVDDTLAFHVRIEVEGTGGGQVGKQLSLEYDLSLKVLEKPMQKGIWRFKLSFQNVPDEFAALEKIESELKVSPWFGLLEEPALGDLGQVAHPALQAIAEGFTAGLGDALIAPPYVWRNELTQGPPHFGGDAIEASCLAEVLGDSFVISRRALAGRQVGESEGHQNFSRALEAQVKCGGSKRAIREVEFRILKKELTREQDDVVFSRLYCRLSAK
jgi:tetratricopeptide (TPR) repeat protein